MNPAFSLQDPDLFRQQAYIGGRWCDAESGATIEVNNPATGEILGTVPRMGANETWRAIEAAKDAFADWGRRPARERSDLMRGWYDLIMANVDDLGALMTAEQGKPLAEAKGEVAYAASFIEWFAEEAKRVYGDTIPSPWQDRRLVVIKQPIGVCAAITPWNFPAAMIARKAGPALASGCTMVSKPAESTPYSALALAVLAERAGIPAGVLNVLTGEPKEIGGEMTSNPDVRKITFTGSTEVGRLLMKQSADTIKKLSLELGGNAPFLVFDDADLDEAVEGAIISKYRNAGQTCVCANRLYVQAGVYDAFAEKLVAAVGTLKVGNGFDPEVLQGPLIDFAAVEKIEDHIQDAVAKGGRVLLGGKRHALGQTFFEPTVLSGVTAQMKVAREETFGPLAPLFRFESDEEGIQMANDTEFGLASYFYSRDVGRAWRAAEALDCGIVGINTGLISNEVAPFGGVKQSGLGREGSHYGMDDFLEIKYLCFGGLGT
jgi:succinate-semialdehyde dehydrogenase/glutarate-semialdehyde dehydrogenase